MILVFLIIGAYLLGSIPSAVWIGRGFYGVDVREHGSRNAGATNTLRVLGRRAAAVVFIMDVAKGFAAVKLFLIAERWGVLAAPDMEWALFYFKIALCVAVVLGHIFPIFAGFRGGKGVATMTGAVMAINFPAVALCFATWMLVLMLSNYVSLSSIVAGLTFPVYTWLVCSRFYPTLTAHETTFACVVAAMLLFTHRKNIRRLRAGTESKIWFFPNKR